MRRPTRAVPAAALGLTLVLAGCSGSDDDTGGESGSEGTSEQATAPGEDLPTVNAEFGETPVIEFPGSGAPATLMSEVIVDGDGAEVGTDDFVVANYVGQVWDGAVFDSSFERGAPTAFSLNQVVSGWKEGLTGTHVGDRVVLSLPPEDGYGPNGGNPGAGIEADDTIVFVVDVIDTFSPDAQGQADATPVEPAPELPVVVDGDLGGPATITIDEDGEAPTDVESTVLAEGTGEPVPDAPGSTVLVQYAAVTWDGSLTESSWEMNGLSTQMVGGGSVVDWLIGVPVGSRVVVLAPESEDGTQPAAAFVFDIVGAVAAPPQPAMPGESGSESASDDADESGSDGATESAS